MTNNAKTNISGFSAVGLSALTVLCNHYGYTIPPDIQNGVVVPLIGLLAGHFVYFTNKKDEPILK